VRLFPPELEIAPNEGFDPKKDIFGRKQFGEVLTRLVSNLEAPAVLLLDAPWGTGKTTFIKMWRGELAKAHVTSIYFDSFANDYHEDAFLTLAGEIVARVVELKPRSSKALETFKTRAVQVAKVLGRASLRFGVRAGSAGLLTGDEVEAAAKEIVKAGGEEAAKGLDELLAERLESHNADREAFDQFRSSLTALSTGLAGKKVTGSATEERDDAAPSLIFIIDELDRCRPPFALDLLQKIKHFFAVPGVIFVLVSSLRQLEASVRLAYGDIDARVYLEKFYHVRILFPLGTADRPDMATETYLYHLLTATRSDRIIEIISLFCRVCPLSLRSLERIAAYCKLYSISVPENSMSISSIIAGLCIMKVTEPDLYALARSGKLSFDPVLSLLRFRDWRHPLRPNEKLELSANAEAWWRFAVGETVDDDEMQRLHSYLARFGSPSGHQIISDYCEVIDGFAFPDS
jgi:hypothetical protein